MTQTGPVTTGAARTAPARAGAVARGRARLGRGMPRRILVGALGVLTLALLWELYILIGPAEAHIEKLKALKELGVDQFAGYLQHDNKEETLRVYGETVIPALANHITAKA